MKTSISTLIFSENKQTSDLIKSYLSEYSNECSVVDCDSFDSVYNSLLDVSDSVLIYDTSKYFDYDFILNVSEKSPNCKILVLSKEVSVDLIVKSMRAGAMEFLAFPLIKSEFFDAINRMLEYSTPIDVSNCKIISVFSNKDGIGKTSIATNLAYELANVSKEKVALIDLNFQMGDVTTFMDLKPSFNISYMLQNLDKVNEKFLLSTFENYKNTSLYVLADTPFISQIENINNKKIETFLNILKKTFSYIVIDAQTNFDAINISALTVSDLVFLVTIANLPALRNTQKCIELFDKLGFDRIKILLNRFMENDDIGDKDVEKVIDRKIFWKIPNNYFTIMSAINKGVPVCELHPDSNVAKSYKNLALLLTDNMYKDLLIKKYENILGGKSGIK